MARLHPAPRSASAASIAAVSAALVAAALVWAHPAAARAFEVHWNIVGANEPEVATLIKPALNACLTYDVTIFSESFGLFPPAHIGSGFAAECKTYPCGLAAIFNAPNGTGDSAAVASAGATGAGSDYSHWEANYDAWLVAHKAKIHSDVAKAGTGDFAGVAILDYENWFLQYETRWQESFNGPFIASWMQFVTAANFPTFDTRMWQLIGPHGWQPPAGTSGWADITQDEQQAAYAASWDYFVAGYVNATLDACKAAMPKAKWGFFAYPWFRHPRQVNASVGFNDDMAWLWSQVDVLAPAFYPEFWTTDDPSKAPCNTTNTPAQDAALYSPNVLEAVRLRDTFNPTALVLPYGELRMALRRTAASALLVFWPLSHESHRHASCLRLLARHNDCNSRVVQPLRHELLARQHPRHGGASGAIGR